MTLCIAWVRQTKKYPEIIMAADSCFTGGQTFHAAPKLFPLRRGDCALACAGNTTYTFSIIEHIRNTIESSDLLSSRAKDVSDLSRTIVDIINETLHNEKDEIDPIDIDFQLIFAGYSWRFQKPYIKEICYLPSEKAFVAKRAGLIKKLPVVTIGDKEVIGKLRYKISKKLSDSNVPENGDFGMIPLQVLHEYIEDVAFRSIDGAPQLLKIYPFAQVLPIGVQITKEGKNEIYYCGRKLLDYEMFKYPIYDIATGETHYMKAVSDEYQRTVDSVPPLQNIARKRK